MKWDIRSVIWFCFLLALPLQFRVVLGEWNGEWESFFLYGTDVLLLIVLAVTPWWRMMRHFPGRWFLMAFVVIGVISLTATASVSLGVFRLSFLLKGIIFAGVSAFWFSRLPAASFAVLGVSAVAQALVGIFQFSLQSDIHLRFLDESVLSAVLSGVAKVVVGGAPYIRAYGLTPHPNVLAAFLMLGLFAGWVVVPTWARGKPARLAAAVTAAGFLVIGLLLTFSRLFVGLSVVAAIVLVIWSLLRKREDRVGRWRFSAIILILFLLMSVLLRPLWGDRAIPSSAEQAVSLRSFYAGESLEIIKLHPIMGVGSGQSIVALRERLHAYEPWIIQPVHSIYLWIASEYGVPALLFLALFFVSVARHVWRCIALVSEHRRRYAGVLAMLVVGFLVAGTLEHLFVTLQQGVLLFWLVIGGTLGTLSDRRSSSRGL